MKASSLDRVGSIIRNVDALPDEFGVVDHGRAAGRKVRVQLVDTTTAEKTTGSGLVLETVSTVRFRYLPNVKPGDSLALEGKRFEILAVQELGRRAWLELKVRLRP